MQRVGDILKIRISGLSNGIHDHHFISDPSEIGLEPNFTEPVDVRATVDKAQHQVNVKAELRTSGTFSCDRCLEEFVQPIDARYNMFYIFDEESAGKYRVDEVRVLSPDTVSIDLTEDVREVVVLSVPLKLLCKQDCKGLCPHCGTNWNTGTCNCKDVRVDSRWEGLANLLND
jgi:uncharacterized protein